MLLAAAAAAAAAAAKVAAKEALAEVPSAAATTEAITIASTNVIQVIEADHRLQFASNDRSGRPLTSWK